MGTPVRLNSPLRLLPTEPLPEDLGGDGRMTGEVVRQTATRGAAEARDLAAKLAAFGVKIANG